MQGITGFGSAILNLCVWVVCTSIGINSGIYIILHADSQHLMLQSLHVHQSACCYSHDQHKPSVVSGTLQQAVLAECICSEVVALPLLFVTNAGRTCDWKIVSTLTLFGVGTSQAVEYALTVEIMT